MRNKFSVAKCCCDGGTSQCNSLNCTIGANGGLVLPITQNFFPVLGTHSSSIAINSNIGLPSPSYKMIFNGNGPQPYILTSFVKVGDNTDFSSPCRYLSDLNFCWDYRLSGEGTTVRYLPAIIQNGLLYIKNMSTSNPINGWRNEKSANGFMRLNFSVNGSFSYTTSAGLNLNQSFDVGFIGYSQFNTSSSSTVYGYIDNICIYPTYSCIPGGIIKVSIAGLQANFINNDPLSPSRCNSSYVNSINSVLNSQVLLTPIAQNSCFVRYRNTFGIYPNTMTIDITLTFDNLNRAIGAVSVESCLGGFGGQGCSTYHAVYGPQIIDCNNGQSMSLVSLTTGTAPCLTLTNNGSIMTVTYI